MKNKTREIPQWTQGTYEPLPTKNFIRKQLHLILFFALFSLVVLGLLWAFPNSNFIVIPISFIVVGLWAIIFFYSIVEWHNRTRSINVTQEELIITKRFGKIKRLYLAKIIAIDRDYHHSRGMGKSWNGTYTVQTNTQKVHINIEPYLFDYHVNKLINEFDQFIAWRNNIEVLRIKKKVRGQIAKHDMELYSQKNPVAYLELEKSLLHLYRWKYQIDDISKINLRFDTSDFSPIITITLKNQKEKQIETFYKDLLFFEILFVLQMKYQIPFTYNVNASRMLLK